MKVHKLFLYALALTLGIGTGFIAVAWTGPTGTAPNSNVSAPLNVGSFGQSKTGGLELNTGGATNGLIVHGKVGIGTISPSHLLTLSDATAVLKINRPSNAASNYSLLAFTTGDVNKFMIGLNADAGAGVDKLGIYDVAGSGASTPVMIFSSGNVAIGTTNPYPNTKFALDNGTNNTWSEMINYFNGSPQGAYGLYTHGTTQAIYADGPVVVAGTISSNAPTGSYGTSFYSPNQPGMYSHSDSSYGMYAHSGSSWGAVITQDNGTAGLVVERSDGAIYSELMSSGYGLLTNQAVQAPAFYYSSDARLKKNIQSIASSTALAKILALNPVTFNWIDPKSATTTQLGFIAQEVERVVPELVTTDASTTMKAVDYARVTPLLVGAVQAQQAQIEDLKAQVAAQDERIAKLESAVEALESKK